MTIIGLIMVIAVIVGAIAFVLSLFGAAPATYAFTFLSVALISLMIWLQTVFDPDVVFFTFCAAGLIFAGFVAWLQQTNPEMRAARQKHLEEQRRKRRANRSKR